ncbi:MAG TPA: hypothetical protein VFX70_04435 [Mycobacteriales bacterium]|nr:hypothetical protein [Mycobacteriales bacterium]
MTSMALADVAAAWQRDGHFQVQGVLDMSRSRALLDEARSFETEAFDRINTAVGWKAHREGGLSSAQRCRAHRAGPALKAMAHDRSLIDIVRTALRSDIIVPTRMGYKYYRAGDFMAAHRDDFKCTVTLSIAVTDNLGIMGWLPELRGLSNSALIEELSQRGDFPQTSSTMPLTQGTVMAFDGFNIPHWRSPFETEDLGILATICYFALD